MKLHKFKQNLNIIFSLFIGLIIGYFLFGNIYILYEKKKDSVEEPYYAYYVNNTSTREMPNKSSGLTLDTAKSSCTSGVTISWNDNNWQAILDYNNYQNNSTTRTKCTLYFKTKPTATVVLNNLVSGANKSSTDVYTVPNKTSGSCTYTLAYDGTSDNNLRYVGANPCNYVTFNGETAGWRIIGILNTPQGQRIKLIRANSIGDLIRDSTSNGRYNNDWTTSALQTLLNSGAYYYRTTGQYYNTSPGSTTTITLDFTSNGLTDTAKNQIDTITWKLGGIGSQDFKSSSNGLASHWYTYERGTKVYTGRPTEWQGKVGLMYQSDYGYATSGGTSMNRASCLAKELYNWDSANDCKNNDWIYNSSIYQWTLSSSSSTSKAVYEVNNDGRVTNTSANMVLGVRPSVHLIPSMIISSGEGTPENPYVLSGN